MNKLAGIVELCKGEVSLTINEHKNMYETVQEHVDKLRVCGFDEEDLPPEVVHEMVRADRVVRLQVYPRSPVGFNVYFGTSIDGVIDQAWEDLT